MAERIHTGASTINDVARLAQVSIKTVSRVMNDEANVRDDTRTKVKEAAKLLNYRPNLLARSLAGARSFLIGLLYDNPNPSYVNDMQGGVISRCRQSGYHLLCEPQIADNPDLERAISDLLMTIRLDGVILAPPLCEMAMVLQAVEAAGVPYVRLSPHVYPGRSAVVRMDERQAAYDMTKYLLAKGHKNIGYVMGHPEHGGAHQRYEGFIRALREIGKEPRTEWVKQGYFTFDSGREAAREMFAGTKRPTAVFAANDYMAFGVMAHLQDIGLKVPEDVSVVGFDDAPGCRLVWPHLTTIRQPVYDMAFRAADILLKSAQGTLEAPMNETVAILPFDLIERASVRDISS